MNTARKILKLSYNFKTNFIHWCAVVATNQQKITYDREFSIVKSGGLKYEFFK